MIPFVLSHDDGTYMVNGYVLPDRELLSYPHTIEGDEGTIHLPYEPGQEVWAYSSVWERSQQLNPTKKKIKEFCTCGGNLCVRFEDSNIPHDVECIAPI